MNLTAIYKRKSFDEDGNTEITFTVKGYQSKMIAGELEKEHPYRMSLSELKNKRSLQQNNLMWSIIHEISIAENGDMATSDDDWNIYISCLEQAQAKFEIVACLPQALPMLKHQFRAIKELNEFEHKGKTFKQVKVFYGSSQMNTAEMTKLLNTVIERAERNGIELNEQVDY